MRVFYSFVGRNFFLFLFFVMVLNVKNKLGKSFKLCLEYNKDFKSRILRDFVFEGTEK